MTDDALFHAEEAASPVSMDLYPTRTSDRPTMIERTHPTAWPGVSTGPATEDDVGSYDRAGYL